MAYDSKADRFGSVASTRQSPAIDALALTAAMISDGVDLPVYAKALRIWNGSSAAVTVMATPLTATSDTAVVPITVPPGCLGYEPISVRRIWSTGSTGLAAALAAGTAEVLLLTA